MNDAIKKILSFLSRAVLKPLVILFFSVYHAAFMLAAPVICARLSLEADPVLREHVLSFFRMLFPREITGPGMMLAVVVVLACIAYAIVIGAFAFRIPIGIIKWNIAHLAALLYGNLIRSIPYILMMAGPALYYAVSFINDPRETMAGLIGGMIITVVSQYGAISLVAVIRSAQDLLMAGGRAGEKQEGVHCSTKDISGALLPAIAVLLLAAPLLALAAASYRAAMGMTVSLAQSILFHVFVFFSTAGAVAFYLRHYGEYLALLVEDDEGEG